MKLAFCLFKFFPFGGLQRDFLKIALACQKRGHSVHVYAMEWKGEVPDGFSLHLIDVKGRTNHSRVLEFSQNVARKISEENYEAVIGFNKMPNIDIYFAADPCYLFSAKNDRSFFYRMTPRFRTYSFLEKEVFTSSSNTEVIILSREEMKRYISAYGTPESRFHLFPPGIEKPPFPISESFRIRQIVKNEFDILDDDLILLMVGSGFRTKGLDRSINALSSLPDKLRDRCILFVVGQGEFKSYLGLANKKRVRVKFLGGRNDVYRFLFAADLLLHPSRTEAYGMVLLEAMASGLPVLVTDVCGYAEHIRKANAGQLISSPFRQNTMNILLADMLGSLKSENWGENGLSYVSKTDIFSLPEKACALIEEIGEKNNDKTCA